MQEISHSQLPAFAGKMTPENFPPVCLIHGQEMLVERAWQAVMEKLLDEEQRELGCETLEGMAENIPDVLEKMNTFALLQGTKVVWFKDAKIFGARSGHQKLVEQIADAYGAGETRSAAKSFLHLCGRLALDAEQAVRNPKAAEPLKALFALIGSEGVTQLGQYCREKGWTAAAAQDQVGALHLAIEKGFPPGHHLLITVSGKVPKTLKLYKLIRDRGVVIDCSVPLGERKADKSAQEQVMRQTLDRLLTAAGKRLPPNLFPRLSQLTGFDLRTFADNVGKLIDYAGSRQEISAADIEAVLRRTKVDPVFELTNAVADRDPRRAFTCLDALLKAEWHPLQILAALANQCRKLLVAKDFVNSQWGRAWTSGMSYPQFQQQVMPAALAFDRHIQEEIAGWGDAGTTTPKAKDGQPTAGDVALAPNPNSAYPVYQTLLKTEKYTLEEILGAMELLSQADLRLKSSATAPGILIKKLVADICRPARLSPRRGS